MEVAAELVSVARRKIAMDALMDLFCRRGLGDGLRYSEIAVVRDDHITRTIGDLLLLVLAETGTVISTRGCAPGSHQAKDTFGDTRSAAVSMWKKDTGFNPPIFATRFEGNCATDTFSSRTAPL